MTPIRNLRRLALVLAIALTTALPAWAEHHETPEPTAASEPAVTPWDQEAVKKLADEFSIAAKNAYTSVYNQGGTTGSAGSGQRRDYIRLRDKVRIIDREARHYRAAVTDGKGHEETLPIFERLMLEVRDARVIGRRVMLQQGTQEKVDAAAVVLQKIAAYYDPKAFDAGPQRPLDEPEFGKSK